MSLLQPLLQCYAQLTLLATICATRLRASATVCYALVTAFLGTIWATKFATAFATVCYATLTTTFLITICATRFATFCYATVTATFLGTICATRYTVCYIMVLLLVVSQVLAN